MARSKSRPGVGERWRNKHTGHLSTVYGVVEEKRQRPTRLAQAPNGRLLMHAYEDYTATIVRFEDGAPPGFDDRKCGGWELDAWLEHWERDEVETARATLLGLAMLADEFVAESRWWQRASRKNWRLIGAHLRSVLGRDAP